MMLALLWEICCLAGSLLLDLLRSGYSNFTPASWRSKDISGQTAVITGAASGIGRLLALRLSSIGCRLALIDISESVHSVVKECEAAGSPKAAAYICDLSCRSDIYSACDRIKEDFPQVDILVNNAGIVTGRKFLDCPDELVERTMAVNATSHFWLVKAFMPGMVARNKGHIVTVASGAGQVGVSQLADYCASKFAAVGFDESLRHELLSSGLSGVSTTCVCPFFINTGMFDGVASRFPCLLPILDPEYVADKILAAVLTDQAVLVLPRLLYFTNVLQRVLPEQCSFRLLTFFGAFDCMTTFRGRSGGAGSQQQQQQQQQKKKH